ncbi:ribonuclease H-like protein [Pleurotus eryngii]|uniref:ribonuclease H n=1 Tax=Pleurotus eryngii TaxID=5323 RepID=A0A9P5ZSJ3_PLEER|nr:ribonuclease H-like protein [Pleurotus eryngii]
MLVTVYTDGSCSQNGAEGARAGSGIWYAHNDPRNKSIRCSGSTRTNQVAELIAVVHVLQTFPKDVPLHIATDSKYVKEGIVTHLRRWEDNGWIGVANRKLFQCVAASLYEREAPTIFKWVKGHAGTEGNEEADRLAAIGAAKEEEDHIDLAAMLYESIRERKDPKSNQRQSTRMNLDIICWAVQRTNGVSPTDEVIWKSLKTKDISHSIRNFMWKTIHGAQKCGEWWRNVPNFEFREACPECHVPESMEHILVDCEAPGCLVIWQLAGNLWEKKGKIWTPPTFGDILGCAAINFTPEVGNVRGPGLTRLYRILVSESAYLIWKLRCERRIQRGDDPSQYHSREEIICRWRFAINHRLKLDCIMTNKSKFDSEAIAEVMVKHTWEGTLMNEESLPIHWYRKSGVLVGIG